MTKRKSRNDNSCGDSSESSCHGAACGWTGEGARPHTTFLLVTEGFDGVEAGGAEGWDHAA
jgi:hypothetical protein